MKRWLFRFLILSAIGGLGFGAVTLAQREWGAGGNLLPDFSKPPVNAEAAAAVSGQRYAGESTTRANPVVGDRYAGGSPAVDPFRTLRGVGQEQTVAEPQRFTPDADAAPVPEPPRPNDLRDGIPAASEVGLTSGGGEHDGARGAPVHPADARASNDTQSDDPYGLNSDHERATTEGPAEKSRADAPGASAPGDRYGNADSNHRGDRNGNDPAEPTVSSAQGGARRMDDATVVNLRSANAGGSRKGNQAGLIPAPPGAPGLATGALESVNDEARMGQGAATSARDDRYSMANPLAPTGRGAVSPEASGKQADSRLLSSSGAGETAAIGNVSNRNENLFQRGPAATPAGALPTTGGHDDTAPFAPSTTGSMAALSGDPPIATTEGMGKPGDQKLEGAQSPNVTIEKIAPPEIQVGKPAIFAIIVRNTGVVIAQDVAVLDAVPQGTQLVSTTPKASVGPHGEVLWKMGDMQPGGETRLEMELMPVEEGEIGSVATVQFRSAASARTIATKPELVLELTAPQQVMIGGDVTIGIRLSNPGTGAASEVRLMEKVPPGFQHPAGPELEFEVGDLNPGETRELDLNLRAVQAGSFSNTLVVEGDANLHTEQTANIEVIAPALEVAIEGPGLRYLERQAKYTVSVSNPGTAPAKDVELVAHLPKGMQFVEASDSGHYEVGDNSVSWALAELPAGQSGSVTLAAVAMEAGEQKLRSEVRAAGGLSDTSEQVTVVEGAASVLFTVVDVDDPVEVGGQATFEIHVVNQGSKAANHVQVAALLPPELKPTSAEGPSKHTINGQQVVFEPMARLAPKADVIYRLVAQAVAPGDLRIKAQLLTEDMTQPVTKEESTRVYKD